MRSIFSRGNYHLRGWRHPFEPVVQLFRDIKYCYQRITKGYCDRDVWNMFSWFLSVVPSMLEELKETTHGAPAVLAGGIDSQSHSLDSNAGHEEWKRILGEMAYLFRESDEDSCQRKNPYETEYEMALETFTEKYGFLGEKLRTAGEIEREEKNHFCTMHTMVEVPEYREIHDKYMEEEQRLYEYRNTCKDNAFELFTKWFWDLWD